MPSPPYLGPASESPALEEPNTIVAKFPKSGYSPAYGRKCAMPDNPSTRNNDTPRHGLDATEREIIKRLAQDGRTPFQTIAKEIGVDEKTVRNRVAKLREKGLLNLIPTANGNNLDGCLVAIVAINISTDIRNSVEDLAARVAELPMVSWVGAVLGQYDLIAEVIVESWDDLTRFELQELPAIAGVGKTTSFLVLSHFGKRGVPFVDAVLNSDK